MNPSRSLLAFAVVSLLVGVTVWSVHGRQHPWFSGPTPTPAAPADFSGISVPPMPAGAVDKHEQGTCSVWTKFNALGLPDSVEVVHTSGYQDLDDYTVSFALAHWHGPPNVRVQSNCHYDWHDRAFSPAP